ncbi:MAG: carbonic anhydrase [Ruminococcaceae bacterium]|nr:carbonic anhydrase [Oscillospiraceae bacterium]
MKDPKRYSEKLQWMKLYYRDPVMRQCADKYTVREYIESKGLGHTLTKLYAVFHSPEEIVLDDLPDKFVMKLSNGSATNLICTDKSTLNVEEVRRQFRDFYAQSGTSAGREWVYITDKKPVIIVEELLEDDTQKDDSLCDYKILCFGGKPHCIICHFDRFVDHRSNILDPEWNDLGVTQNYPRKEEAPRPSNLEEMLHAAEVLSADFPAVRVDMYCIQGKTYFGELTFFPWSGYVRFTPDSFDFELGEKFILPERNH